MANNALTTVTGFPLLNSIGGDFYICVNEVLTTINGSVSLNFVGGGMFMGNISILWNQIIPLTNSTF